MQSGLTLDGCIHDITNVLVHNNLALSHDKYTGAIVNNFPMTRGVIGCVSTLIGQPRSYC